MKNFGWFQCASPWSAFVDFDKHHELGRAIILFPTYRATDMLQRRVDAGEELTVIGNGSADGYKYDVRDFDPDCYRFRFNREMEMETIANGRGKINKKALDIMCVYLELLGYENIRILKDAKWRRRWQNIKATNNGVTLYFNVRSRDQSWNTHFFQLHEDNPNGITE